MSKEILIHAQKGNRQVAIVESGQLEDFLIEADRHQSLLGNIYKGKVESILPSINAAFVNIGQEKNGFLYLTDVVNPLVEDELSEPRNFLEKIFKHKKAKRIVRTISKPPPIANGQTSAPPAPPVPAPAPPPQINKDYSLKVGQEIMVQVVKDPFGEKGARLTSQISLPGRFVVYMPYERSTGVSKKIDDSEERQRLREFIKGFTFAKTGGFIIRTAALKQGKNEIMRDAKSLYRIWQDIRKEVDKKSAPAMIFQEGGLTWKIVRDYLTEKIDKVILDSEDDYEQIKKNVNNLIGQEMVSKIHLYRGSVSLFEEKNVLKQLEKIYESDVYVKSGAYIVIEPTEGLTVIDVNSGKFKTKASPGEAAFMVNMEVVPEIARQLRLRDLGGIIVIDFIDMTREDHKRKLTDALQRALSKDYAKTEVYKISPLGIVEMTRARTGKTIESISFGPCPYCAGRGRVKVA